MPSSMECKLTKSSLSRVSRTRNREMMLLLPVLVRASVLGKFKEECKKHGVAHCELGRQALRIGGYCNGSAFASS